MNYTLHQLQIFLKIVQTKSITKAAEELNLTQPAVSIQLKKLQDQFDIPLTEVIGRQLYVTHFGNEIAITAQKVLDEVETITYKSKTFKGILSGKLMVSVVSTGKYVMPYFLCDFLNQNKGIDLIMDVTNKSKVVNSLENNEVDFALVSVLPTGMDVEKLDLLQNKLIPLYVKSFIDPHADGTVIQDSTEFDHLVPSFIFKMDQVLFSFTTRDFSFIVEENLSHLFNILSNAGVQINLMQNSALNFSILAVNHRPQFFLY